MWILFFTDDQIDGHDVEHQISSCHEAVDITLPQTNSQGTRKGVPLTVYPWYLMCSTLGFLGIMTHVL